MQNCLYSTLDSGRPGETLVKDSLHVSLPVRCKLKQVAIRRDKVLAGQKRFVIDKNAWNKLSPTQQAGLVLHEIVYDHFYLLGEKDSRTARAFQSFISRLVDTPVSEMAYRKMVRGLKIPLYR